MKEKLNVPLLAFLALVAAAMFAFEVHEKAMDPRAAIEAWAAFVFALFVRAQKIAHAGATGDTASSGVLVPSGGIGTTRESSEAFVLSLKRALLAEWAKKGDIIDEASEAKAELQARDIHERGSRKFELPAPPKVPE